METNTRHFYDIDLSFKKNPLTNDIAKKVDANAIKQSLYNLIMYNLFDVPFHPEISSRVRSMLFENFTPLTKISLERIVRTTIENFEPRVSVNDVIVSEDVDNNALSISMHYTIIKSSKPQTYKFYVYRTR